MSPTVTQSPFFPNLEDARYKREDWVKVALLGEVGLVLEGFDEGLDAVRLEVRLARGDADKALALDALNSQHLLGTAKTAGDSLWQLVFLDGKDINATLGCIITLASSAAEPPSP